MTTKEFFYNDDFVEVAKTKATFKIVANYDDNGTLISEEWIGI